MFQLPPERQNSQLQRNLKGLPLKTQHSSKYLQFCEQDKEYLCFSSTDQEVRELMDGGSVGFGC
jgi:hypothetical protein